MKINKLRFLVILLAAFILISVPGVHAVWTYATGAIAPVIITNTITLGKFDYDSPKGSLDDIFEATLNNTTSFNNLKNEFTNQTVISTKDPNDKALIDSIFGSNPTITFNGQTLTVDDIYIQRADVNGKNTGADGSNEYTVYLEADGKVYAMAFAGDSTGNWSRIDQMYQGTMTNGNVDSWKADSGITYKIGDYEYKVGDKQSGVAIYQLTTIKEIMSASDNDLLNRVNNNPTILEKAYLILSIEYVKNTQQNEILQQLKNALKTLKGIQGCVSANINASQISIRLNNSCARSELAPPLIDIFDAVDKYEKEKDQKIDQNYFNQKVQDVDHTKYRDAEWNKW